MTKHSISNKKCESYWFPYVNWKLLKSKHPCVHSVPPECSQKKTALLSRAVAITRKGWMANPPYMFLILIFALILLKIKALALQNSEFCYSSIMIKQYNNNNNNNNKMITIIIIIIIIFPETRKFWVDVQLGKVSSHGERDPLQPLLAILLEMVSR